MVRRTDEGNSYELEALNTTARNSIDRSKSKVWEPSGVKTWRLPFIGARVAGATSSRPRTGNSLFQMADSIRTYTEQLHTELRAKIDEALSNAELIVILGFGFHSQNLELFKPINNRGMGPKGVCYGKAHRQGEQWRVG